MRSALLCGVLALSLSGCATLSGPPPKPAPPPDPHTQMAALESRVYDLIESERLKINPAAKPLALDSELVGVARQKSGDMAAKNYLAHKAPTGETTADIVMDRDADFQGLLGENIAADGYNAKFGIDVDAYAHAIVNTWIASEDHRQNLSYTAYNRTGIGAAVNGDTVYVTELFATDLGLPPPEQQHAQSHRQRPMQQYASPSAAGADSLQPTTPADPAAPPSHP